jgi:hypothetical protein
MVAILGEFCYLHAMRGRQNFLSVECYLSGNGVTVQSMKAVATGTRELNMPGHCGSHIVLKHL